ncbi:hypothetical protein [Ruminiclostridium cellobioparum]|uniref:hypothetical protein n=1 Tax=Ruminiclostridium cellobioparum TaxID=29355 RepID=UPI000486B61D|nr:hypothetical protein [Ruminiclostridium cellobioparum]
MINQKLPESYFHKNYLIPSKEIFEGIALNTRRSFVPADLFAKFQTSFYTTPEDAVFKALGIE